MKKRGERMKFQKQIHDYVYGKKDEMLRDLAELVRIPSVLGEPEEGAPFGKACAEVLHAADRLYQKHGFQTENRADRGYLLSFYGEGEEKIGVFAHADVVGVGEDWTLSAPFEPTVKDGFMIGRGVKDDKSAVILSLYLARALRDLQIPLKHGLVFFTGANEETGMIDMENYLADHTPPRISIVPDSDFPCAHGEKGIHHFWAKGTRPLCDVIEVTGGTAFNIVLGEVSARLRYSDALYQELKAQENADLQVTEEKGEIHVTAFGVSAHAAFPQASRNAAKGLFEALANCSALAGSDRAQAAFLAQVFSETDGKTFGVQNRDSIFGDLTMINGMIRTEEGALKLSFDSRFGDGVSFPEMQEKLRSCLAENGFDYLPERYSSAFHVDKNDPLVQKTLAVYREFTGDMEADAFILAGGTYAKELPYALEIGNEIPHPLPFELPAGHGAEHQPDECLSVEGFLEAVEFTIGMILEIDEC